MYSTGFLKETKSIENTCIITLGDLLGRYSGSEVGESTVAICVFQSQGSSCYSAQADRWHRPREIKDAVPTSPRWKACKLDGELTAHVCVRRLKSWRLTPKGDSSQGHTLSQSLEFKMTHCLVFLLFPIQAASLLVGGMYVWSVSLSPSACWPTCPSSTDAPRNVLY